jgi:hypothetical protein
MNEPKCFAETADRGKCAVLTLSKCQGHKKCSFFKTEERAELDRQKAFERISSLSFEQQIYIAKTYYSGKLPWNMPSK